jgi:uncharacterized membrane protein
MFVVAASDASGAFALGGLMIVALVGVSLIISIVWIVFPFIVDNHLRKLRGLQQDANYYLRKMAEEVVAANASVKAKAPPPPALPKS